jgi:Family of unknown function (DUF5906)/Domain of unknown function (DUF3854)
MSITRPTSEDVLAEFVRRGMTEDDVRAMHAEGDLRTGRLNRRAIKLPYFEMDGRESGFNRWRCLDDLEPKYLQDARTGAHVYIPQGPDWARIAADPTIALGLSEAEFKSYVVTSRAGIPTLGLGGVNSYGSKRAGEIILKELTQFNWAGRTLLLMFDSDSEVNPHVAAALADCALKLSGLGARPLKVCIPCGENGEKLGADDYILKYGHIAFQQLPKVPFAQVEQLHRLNQEYAFIRNPVGIYSFSAKQIISQADFLVTENKNSTIVPAVKGFKTVKAGTEWLLWPGRREHLSVTYKPGESAVTDADELNTFPGWGCEPLIDPEGCLEFLWLMDRLIPNERMRNWVIQWLGHMIQKPNEKVMSALVMSGPQGTGKSLLTEMLAALVGEANTATIGNLELASQFTGWAANKLLIIAEEVSGLDPKHDAARLKSFVTGPTVTINEKYIKAYTLPHRARFIFCSNEDVAVFTSPDDRRYAHCRTLKENKIQSHIGAALKKWLMGYGASYLRHYLSRVDLTGFDPTHAPPLTADKLEVIESSRTSLQSWANDLMNDDERPSLALSKALEFTAREDCGPSPHAAKAVHKALKAAGAIQLPRVRINSRRKQGIWSLRGPVEDMSETALRATFNAETRPRDAFFGLGPDLGPNN